MNFFKKQNFVDFPLVKAIWYFIKKFGYSFSVLRKRATVPEEPRSGAGMVPSGLPSPTRGRIALPAASHHHL